VLFRSGKVGGLAATAWADKHRSGKTLQALDQAIGQDRQAGDEDHGIARQIRIGCDNIHIQPQLPQRRIIFE